MQIEPREGWPFLWASDFEPCTQRSLWKTPQTRSAGVWFPYKWVRSASDIVEITDDRFGPFKGQMLVGDFQNAVLTRVQLEKVNGEWQGAVWPFLKGFQSGVNRMVLGNDGQLYVGSGNKAGPPTLRHFMP